MIVFYVHHHGSGHAHRATAVAARCAGPVLGLGSRPAPTGWPGPWIELPPDVGGPHDPAEDVTAGGVLHWAPRHHDGLRERMAILSSVLRDGPARLLVADVSVEVALLARLHGVPVAVVAQPGRRTDRPHRSAYDLADVVLAPWPRHAGRTGWPVAWRAKTVHLGALSRYDGRSPEPTASEGRRVLVLTGSGGDSLDAPALRAAAAATPGWRWRAVGPAPPAETRGDGVSWAGWLEDVWPELLAAEVVVSHAGQNAVAEIAAARRAAVIVPQERPHREQLTTGRWLARRHLAVVRRRWPRPAQWPGVLDLAAARGGAGWSSWSDGAGAHRAAAVLDRLAAR